MRLLTILFTLFISVTAFAQLPNTNVYLFDLNKKDGKLGLQNPRFLTDFNRNGYNNQPFFFSDNEIYLTVQFPNDTTQTDIYSLNLQTGLKTQITGTDESEYSAALTPNYYNFSAVRVEKDGNDTQRLWVFPVDRMTPGQPLFKFITGVGYYCWVNSQQVALFIVSQPNNRLVLVNTKDQSQQTLETLNVGRCLKRTPRGQLAFVDKESPNSWVINIYDPRSKTYTPIIKTLAGSEDFEVLKDGSFIMGQGTKLYHFDPNNEDEKGWQEVVDLRYYDISKITRLAISANNRLAIVAQ